MLLKTPEISGGKLSPLSYTINNQNNKWLIIFKNTQKVRIVFRGAVIDNPGDLRS